MFPTPSNGSKGNSEEIPGMELKVLDGVRWRRSKGNIERHPKKCIGGSNGFSG
jgi:hypothetical protein